MSGMPEVVARAFPTPPGVAGVALLEVLVALSILGTSGLAFLALVQGAVQAQAVARTEERQLGRAERVLTATSLLRRVELDQRLGSHEVGEFLVSVQRPERGLYRIAIAAGTSPGVELLTTVVYRPDPPPGVSP